MLVEVLLKVIAVLATPLEVNSVLLWVFSCYVQTEVVLCNANRRLAQSIRYWHRKFMYIKAFDSFDDSRDIVVDIFTWLSTIVWNENWLKKVREFIIFRKVKFQIYNNNNNNNNNNNSNSLFHLELIYFYKSKENLNVQGAGYPE